MNKTSIIVYVEKLQNLPACLWSIRTFTAPGTYDIALVSEKPLDDAEDVGVKAYTGRGVEGINQAIFDSNGEQIVFLYDDVLVTSHWLDRMSAVLESSPDCSAVGPVGYNVYVSTQIAPERKDYTNIREMAAVAAEYAVKNKGKICRSLYLDAFCILLQKSSLRKLGGLDRGFASPYMAFAAHAMDLAKQGRSCLVAKEVWLHNTGCSASATPKDRDYFIQRYGFWLTYSTQIRTGMLQNIDLYKKGLCLLDIGCACGGNLMRIGDLNPTAELYGIELSDGAAKIARNFGRVWQADMLKIDNEDFVSRFDYILMGDVLEHIVDTDAALDKVYSWLRPGGQLLVSVPNITHISIIRQMLEGRFTYENAGILDRTHMRFFTYREMMLILKAHGFRNIGHGCTELQSNAELRELRSELLALKSVKVDSCDLDAYQWLFLAEKPMP